MPGVIVFAKQSGPPFVKQLDQPVNKLVSMKFDYRFRNKRISYHQRPDCRPVAIVEQVTEQFHPRHSFLDHAEISHPRVVVIDMFMPDLNGLEVQQRLSEYSPATRVIVLTANGDRAVRWTALAAGAVAFFVKPARCDDFIASIRSAFAAS